MDIQKARIALIGCGKWGTNHARVLSSLGVLSGIYDTNDAQLKAISAQYAVPVLSFRDILASQNINAVVIATPAYTHYDIAKACLEAKKHVLVEKPLALKESDAEALHALSEQHGVILMVGHLLQYHPGFMKALELKRKGDLGKLQYIYSNRLNLGKFRQEENIWWSFAPHDVSMILALVGEPPNSIHAVGSAFLNPRIADVTTTHLTFPNGIRAHIFVSWLHPYRDQKLVVVGEKGMLVFDDTETWERKLCFYTQPVEWVEGIPQSKLTEATPIALTQTEPLIAECSHFIECIQHLSKPRTDGIEGIQVIKVLTAAQHSMESFSTMTLSSDIHPSAIVDADCHIGENTKIWHYSHILSHSHIGKNCIIGQNASIGPKVIIGNGCKIQNNVSIYEGVTLEDSVFIGPSAVFTNVTHPRAFVDRREEFLPTLVKTGATIGANATIVCGVTLGEFSFVAAGAVVTKNVPAFALMVGVPARQVGWVSKSGEKLGDDLICPRTGEQYQLVNHQLVL